jgi:hypothetical protein
MELICFVIFITGVGVFAVYSLLHDWKAAFTPAFMLLHALTGFACLFISFASVFNMCGPAHPASFATYLFGGAGAVLMFPLGWLAVPLLISSDRLAGIVFLPILANSYLWSELIWRRWRRR